MYPKYMLTYDTCYEFSPEAQAEIHAFIKALPRYEKIEDAAALAPHDCPAFRKEVEGLRTQLEAGKRMVIIRPFADLRTKYSVQEQRIISWLIGNALGEPLVQNEAGDKVICVYDRDRSNSMANGARYHQTREGGTIHTDNVNVPFHWEYMVLTCISPAATGGENILVDGVHIHAVLKEHHPDALEILEKNFLWEKRGIEDATYEAPIITYDGHGEPLFRHLRPYMESAHRKLNQPLSDEQRYAVDTLDAIIEHSGNQYRHTFVAGEILLTYDSQVFHGRTCFADSINALTINEWSPELHLPMKRTMDRMWIKKRT